MIGIILFAAAATIAVAVAFTTHTRSRASNLRRHVEELALVADLSEILQLATSVEEAAAVLPKFAPRLFPGCDGALYVAGMTPDSLAMAAAWGEPCDMLAFAPADCWAIRRGRAHLTDATRVACRHKESETPTLCMPLIVGGEAFGVLVLRGVRALERGVAVLAGRVAAQLARVLSNLRMNDTLRSHAVRDELTGLYNRRYLQLTLVRELQRSDVNTGVIVADVDNFKRYNDTWGHPGGDALLQHLARLMQRVVGEDDIVCRFGGEEFVIIVPNATFEELHATAEHLREESAALHIRLDGRVLGRITLSAGIALSPRHGTSVEELIAAADRALYVAKTSGRDRVAAPPPTVIGRDAA